MVQMSFSAEPDDWARFLDQLSEYVTMQLRGEDAGLAQPQVEYWIETDPRCERAYYAEFRRQGLQRTPAQLRAIATLELHGAMTVATGPTSTAAQDAPPEETNLMVRTFAWGRARLERTTLSWRDVVIEFAALTATETKQDAWQGMMSARKESASEAGQIEYSWELAPDDAPFALRILAAPLDAAAMQMRVTLVVTLLAHFGDYSGVVVTLQTADGVSRHGVTDEQGIARFDHIDRAVLTDSAIRMELPK